MANTFKSMQLCNVNKRILTEKRSHEYMAKFNPAFEYFEDEDEQVLRIK